MADELFGGAVLGAAVGELMKAVLDVTNKAIKFRSILKSLQLTLKSIEPVFAEINRLNKVLDRPLQETLTFTDRLENGKKLVCKCSAIRWWNYARSKLMQLVVVNPRRFWCNSMKYKREDYVSENAVS